MIERSFQELEAEKEAILNGISFNLVFVSTDYDIIWANRVAAESVKKNEGQ